MSWTRGRCSTRASGRRALNLDSASRRASIRLKVLDAALRWLDAGQHAAAFRLLGVDFDERGVRAGMETCYRALARDAADGWVRIALVERANAVRPRTRT